jgi:hypothetical protein
MAAYLTQPLHVRCRDLDEVRRFLAGCRYVSDREQFQVQDYWMPPEEFERRRQGDCDCAGLWAWRQLVELGYAARFVVGRAGPFGGCHAWVTFREGGDWFALEPFVAWLGPRMPRLRTLYYQPVVSAVWDGQRILYYEHQPVRYLPRSGELLALWSEAALFRIRKTPQTAWAWARYLGWRGCQLLRVAAEASWARCRRRRMPG